MKKIVLALVLVSFIATLGFAAWDNAGCGIGYLIMKDQEGLLFEVLAVTAMERLQTRHSESLPVRWNVKNRAVASRGKLNTYVAQKYGQPGQ